MSETNRFWRRLAYAGSRYGPTPWVRYSPAFFGAAFALALPEKRRTVRDNLRRIRGARPFVQEQWDVLRTFMSYAHCLSESLAGDREEARKAHTQAIGKRHIDAVLAEKKGAILVTAHCGAWDPMAGLLRRDCGVDVAVVMAREDDPEARRLHDEVRQRTGVSVVHVGKHPLEALSLAQRLRAGGVVAIQLDRAPAGTPAIEVPLFGEPFSIPKGPFLLAALSQAPIVPLFCRRLGFFHYEVEVCPAIRLPRRPNEDQLKTAAQQAVQSMEQFLRESPTQWFHFAG